MALAAAMAAGGSIAADSLDDALNCTGEWAGSALCLERKSATEQKAKIEALLADLDKTPNPPWQSETFADARSQYEEGLELFRQEFYGDASQRFGPALASLLQFDDTLTSALSDSLAAARAALQAEDYSTAADLLARVADWPDTPASAAGDRELAEAGMKSRHLLERAREAVARRDLAAAEQALSQIPGSVWIRSVATIRRQLAEIGKDDAFNNAMTYGYSRFEAGEWQEALSAFQSAARIKPAAASANDAIRETELRIAEEARRSLLETAAGYMEQEDWIRAQQAFEALAKDLPKANATFRSSIDRAKRYVEAEVAIDGYLANLGGLTRTSVRNQASQLTQQVDSTYGKRIGEKASKLREAIELYSSRSKVTVVSDGQTTIRFVPGRNFGRFDRKTFSLVPGSYRLIGTRKGYREVSIILEIKPNDPPREFRIVCNAAF